ncbi:MAG: DUF547 domain-containing protein [Cyclobacteriaceae bacterium]|nr:DUF547 domain-containing protein [Cyclobacteriaceae bacterium]
MTSCFNGPTNASTGKIVSHNSYDSLLQKHVDKMGMVNYEMLALDSGKLNKFIGTMGRNTPNWEQWKREEIISYYLNLYNASTLQLVLRNYPLQSIKDIGPTIQIPFVNTPWQLDFIKMDDELFNLDDIEHGILREKFEEPRIHFALVCAAISCPKLRNEAYTAEKLESQLEDQTHQFLGDTSKNSFEQEEIKLSKLFSWYKGDFDSNRGVLEFIGKYRDIPEGVKVSYKNYNWKLNEQ